MSASALQAGAGLAVEQEPLASRLSLEGSSLPSSLQQQGPPSPSGRLRKVPMYAQQTYQSSFD